MTADRDNGSNSNTRSFDRRSALTCQLEMAVRARLQFDNLVAALTLAGAAERVLSDGQPSDATVSAGFHSIKAFCNEYVKEDSRERVAAQIRRAYDQLRHADKEPAYIHNLDSEAVDALLLMTIYAHAGKPKEKNFVTWFNSLPPILGAFMIWMFLNDPRGTTWTTDLGNDPESLKLFRSLPVPIAFSTILELVESKSLIPNPESP